jgi:hypothetical protein
VYRGHLIISLYFYNFNPTMLIFPILETLMFAL